MGCGIGSPILKPEVHSKINSAKKTKSLNLDKMDYSDLDFIEKVEIENLVLLSAENNRLYKLPITFFKKQKKIKKLLLSNNKFVEFPFNINDNQSLDKIVLSHNLIRIIPPSISNITNLKDLNLSYNKLSKIPQEFTLLINLEILDLSFNHFSQFHPFFLNIPKLQYLTIRNNEISSLPKSEWALSSLTTLDISFNNLTEIPVDLFKHSQISAMNLKSNKIHRSDLYNIDGFLEFEERRKHRKDQGFTMNLDINFNLCGLES